MKSHHASSFTPRQLALADLCARIVAEIPQVVPVEEFRCHEVARIVGALLDIPFQDGKYGIVDHSWCWTEPFSTDWDTTLRAEIRRQARDVAILDPYAAGSMPPVRLLALDALLPHLLITYQPTAPRTDIRHELVREVTAGLMSKVNRWKLSEPELLR